jgi:hypothetical protein
VSLVKRKDNAVDVRITSKLVVDFLKGMGIISNNKYIPSWIEKDLEYTKACIRGLVDTEGYISFKKYLSHKSMRIYKQLDFTNLNISLMAFVRDSLVNLGFNPTKSLERSLYISNPQDLKKILSTNWF